MALSTEGLDDFDSRHRHLHDEETQRQDRLIELHERFACRDIDEVSASVRNDVLELLQAIEYDEMTFDDQTLRSDTIKQLWGKVAYLNGQLGLKHPETAVRYGIHGNPVAEVQKGRINISELPLEQA